MASHALHEHCGSLAQRHARSLGRWQLFSVCLGGSGLRRADKAQQAPGAVTQRGFWRRWCCARQGFQPGVLLFEIDFVGKSAGALAEAGSEPAHGALFNRLGWLPAVFTRFFQRLFEQPHS
jgi:hypothetical protein